MADRDWRLCRKTRRGSLSERLATSGPDSTSQPREPCGKSELGRCGNEPIERSWSLEVRSVCSRVCTLKQYTNYPKLLRNFIEDRAVRRDIEFRILHFVLESNDVYRSVAPHFLIDGRDFGVGGVIMDDFQRL